MMHRTNSGSRTMIPYTDSGSRAVILTQKEPRADSEIDSEPRAENSTGNAKRIDLEQDL
jgi:hypothetical protein